MNLFVQQIILVQYMKEIVILMENAKKSSYVDQIIAQIHLVLIQKLIVVMMELLEMKIFVHL